MIVNEDRTELQPDEAIGAILGNWQLRLDSIMIAECVSFDEKRNCVTVQPLLQRRINGVVKNREMIQDVPVAYYGAGDVVITFRPKKGDVCLLMANDRSLTKWKLKGGITDPQSQRNHNATDSIAYFGLNDFTRGYQAIKGGIDIRTRDGSTSINLDAGKIDMTVGGAPYLSLTGGKAKFSVPIEAPEMKVEGKTETKSLVANGKEMVNHVHDDSHGGTTGPNK